MATVVGWFHASQKISLELATIETLALHLAKVQGFTLLGQKVSEFINNNTQFCLAHVVERWQLQLIDFTTAGNHE